jgi:2',3'-cyclic-nucleotide 2'-phosphodiesterase
MSETLKLLFFGDVMGQPGRSAVSNALAELRPKYKPKVVIANVENATHGRGINRKHVEEILRMGVDVLTSGNHIWDQKDIEATLSEYGHKLLRPGNYPDYPDNPCPGSGIVYYKFQSDRPPLAIVNVQGRVFMDPIDCPFGFMDKNVDSIQSETKLIFVDFHGQASSEKMAFAHYFDGQVSAIVGTHTHVQTADAQIFPQGTAYMTDAGLTGSQFSVIGMRPMDSLFRMRTKRPRRLEVANERVEARGLFLEIDIETGKALKIEPFQIPL